MAAVIVPQGQLEKNVELIQRLEAALRERGHDPKRMEGVIHHCGPRFTNIWVMPLEKRQGRGKLLFYVLRIGVAGRDADQVREHSDPFDVTVPQLVQFVEDWMKQFPNEPQRGPASGAPAEPEPEQEAADVVLEE